MRWRPGLHGRAEGVPNGAAPAGGDLGVGDSQGLDVGVDLGEGGLTVDRWLGEDRGAVVADRQQDRRQDLGGFDIQGEDLTLQGGFDLRGTQVPADEAAIALLAPLDGVVMRP